MAGFANWGEVFAALTTDGRSQRLFFSKGSTYIGSTVGVQCTTWAAATAGYGSPFPAGTFPTAGLGSAAVCLDSSTGGVPYTNPSGGRTMHLVSFQAGCLHTGSPTRGAIMLVDRICHANISRNQATGNFSPALDATSRLASGEGGQIFIECSVALGTGNTDRTFTYTNEAGTASRTTASVKDGASQAYGEQIMDRATKPYGYFVELQAGDKGVRSIEACTLGTSGTATGEWCISIVRPLAIVLGHEAGGVYSMNAVDNLPPLPRIYDDTCFAMILNGSNNQAPFCSIVIAEN